LRQSQRQPVILEGELPGDIPETHARYWLPGRCGLLRLMLFGAGEVRWQAQRLPVCDREIADGNWLWQKWRFQG
jgi:hypothetical protein